MGLSIHSPDELIAALPHLLGFKPEESLIFVPLGPDLPLARADIPSNARDRDEVWTSIGGVFQRHVPSGSRMAVVCITGDRDHADHLSQDFAHRLASLGIDTPLRLWADDTHYCDFTTGEAGLQTDAARTRIAATTVLMGRATPVASRGTLGASLVGDREPVAALLPDTRATAAGSSPRAEARWATRRLHTFHHDGIRLNDADAARLLVGLESLPIRDSLWDDITRTTVTSHQAFWRDLTRRGPDEVRAGPAALLAFSSWLNGDGAMAWCALDQIPQNQPYQLADLVAATLREGLNPRNWDPVMRQNSTTTSALLEPIRPGLTEDPSRPAPGI